MADNTATATKSARILVIVHIIVGILLVCLGIADRVVGRSIGSYICMGIWTGIWMLITAGLGIPGTRDEPSTSRNAFASVFMGFSITSAVFGGLIVLIYGISASFGPTAITLIILTLGIIEFAIGIWAAVCLCLMKPCCASSPQQDQIMHTTSSGFVMTQGLGGVPLAVPMQSNHGMVALQTVTPGAQEWQPQMVLVPVSGKDGNQPQLFQVVPYGTMASGHQPHHIDMPPPSYEEGQHTTQQNQQV